MKFFKDFLFLKKLPSERRVFSRRFKVVRHAGLFLELGEGSVSLDHEKQARFARFIQIWKRSEGNNYESKGKKQKSTDSRHHR